MGKLPENSRRERLADMSIQPPPEPGYIPPGLDVATENVTPIDLGMDDQLVIRQRYYRGKTVDFAIMQKIRIGQKWIDVARIDCCHSMIHRHQFNRQGVDVYDRRVIINIPAEEAGWDIVHAGYDDAYTAMLEEWDQNLERWRNGG